MIGSWTFVLAWRQDSQSLCSKHSVRYFMNSAYAAGKGSPRIKEDQWIRGWMQEDNVSLRKPNKRFQIKQADREERISEYFKNI